MSELQCVDCRQQRRPFSGLRQFGVLYFPKNQAPLARPHICSLINVFPIFFFDCLILEDGTDTLCRNVGNHIPRQAAQHRRRAKTRCTGFFLRGVLLLIQKSKRCHISKIILTVSKCFVVIASLQQQHICFASSLVYVFYVYQFCQQPCLRLLCISALFTSVYSC